MRHLVCCGVVTLAPLCLLPSCVKPPAGGSDGGTCTPASAAGSGTEWVNFRSEVPLQASAFDPLASGLFGSAAQAGQFISQQEIAKSFYVTSAADPTTPAQTRLTFAYDDGSGTPRTLATTPASFELGQIFISTVDAALAQMAADVASNNAGGEIFNLAYQVTSSQGGSLTFAVNGNQGATTLALDVTTPHTSLAQGQIGTAVSTAAPYDTVAGTVNFTMVQDEFDYFTDHAYGAGATGGQNFTDFELVPYLWLRLSVTPDAAENIVNVAFDVVTPSGSRIPLAQAPASVMAGNTYQTLVDRQMANMAAQEAQKAGSSTPWSIPFHYDEPAGGGVVQVIASGAAGIYSIAYSVASPQHPLVEVPFVPYKAVTFPAPDPNAALACYQLDAGYTQSLTGVFQITFTPSNVILAGLDGGQQLVGDIACSIYHASDVTVTGPNANAQSVEDFVVPAANLTGTPPPTYTSKNPLTDGDYQILCAQHVDGKNSSDKGDPVTLPIGSFPIACNLNPVTVEFAILDPSNQ